MTCLVGNYKPDSYSGLFLVYCFFAKSILEGKKCAHLSTQTMSKQGPESLSALGLGPGPKSQKI